MYLDSGRDFLDLWASSGPLDTRFYIVQAVELIAGGANLALMGLNILDGLRLTNRLQPGKSS